jgi:hypothetical protein
VDEDTIDWDEVPSAAESAGHMTQIWSSSFSHVSAEISNPIINAVVDSAVDTRSGRMVEQVPSSPLNESREEESDDGDIDWE